MPRSEIGFRARVVWAETVESMRTIPPPTRIQQVSTDLRGSSSDSVSLSEAYGVPSSVTHLSSTPHTLLVCSSEDFCEL